MASKPSSTNSTNSGWRSAAVGLGSLGLASLASYGLWRYWLSKSKTRKNTNATAAASPRSANSVSVSHSPSLSVSFSEQRSPSSPPEILWTSNSNTILGLVRILTLNDVYSQRASHDGTGGWASLPTLIRKYSTPQSVLTLNGDFLGGSTLAVRTKGKGLMDIVNQLHFDYLVLGNHEFDYGEDVLCQRMRESNSTWLGSNVTYAANGKLLDGLCDVSIRTFTVGPIGNEDTIRVGFFGICTPATPQMSYPTKKVAFLPVIETAKRCVRELKAQGADLIVALTHVSLPEDRLLASTVTQIDLILGGHEHTPMAVFEGSTLILKCGQNAEHLGVVDLRVEITRTPTTRHVRMYPSWRLVVNRAQPDAELSAFIDQVLHHAQQHQTAENQQHGDVHEPLVKIKGTLLTLTDTLRRKEGSMGNMIADALVSFYEGAELGVINGGFVRGDRVYEEDVTLTVDDLLRELPFPRAVTMVGMKGAAIKRMFEQQLRFLPDPSGAFPHISRGWQVEYDPSQAVNKRVVSVRFKGVPVDDNHEYKVVCTEFMAGGGDGITAFTEGPVLSPELKESDKTIISSVVIKYLRYVPGGTYTLALGRMKNILG